MKAYFGAAHSLRRLTRLHELNTQLSRTICTPADRFACFPELAGREILALDGHDIAHATHEPPARLASGQSAVPDTLTGLFLRNLRTGAARVLAERARTNKLKVDELQGGTFTLSNYGVSGSRFQTPVIVQPQVGILGVGNIEKRAVVISQGHPLDPNRGDYMAFRPMTTLGFSYDHRVLDGATADAFCAAVKGSLEGWG